jgi:hypothetical protein
MGGGEVAGLGRLAERSEVGGGTRGVKKKADFRKLQYLSPKDFLQLRHSVIREDCINKSSRKIYFYVSFENFYNSCLLVSGCLQFRNSGTWNVWFVAPSEEQFGAWGESSGGVRRWMPLCYVQFLAVEARLWLPRSRWWPFVLHAFLDCAFISLQPE